VSAPSDPSSASRPALDEWLAARCPTPPAALLARLREVLPATGVGADECVVAGEALLEALLQRDCVARGGALDLLVADALVTYAFEVAADEPGSLEHRAERAMLRIAALGDEPMPGAPAPTEVER
jgi:hypothetical protein